MNHEYWYLSRAAGFTAYLLLFASAMLGMLMSTRLGSRLRLGNVPFDLHRFVSVLALAFSLFHVYVLLGDQYFRFSIWTLSVPMQSPYRPISTALGVLGLYSLILIIGSFYVKRFIGHRAWRTLHYLTFAMYLAVTAHGLFAGTDTTAPWALMIYGGTAAAMVLMIAYRIEQSVGKRRRQPSKSGVVSVASERRQAA